MTIRNIKRLYSDLSIQLVLEFCVRNNKCKLATLCEYAVVLSDTPRLASCLCCLVYILLPRTCMSVQHRLHMSIPFELYFLCVPFLDFDFFFSNWTKNRLDWRSKDRESYYHIYVLDIGIKSIFVFVVVVRSGGMSFGVWFFKYLLPSLAFESSRFSPICTTT